MLLVFGGTTEGRRCAQALADHALPFVYSTKDPVTMPPLPGMRVRHGALTPDALAALCRAEDIRGIVHAAHPFAAHLHAAIAATAAAFDLPVWRFERCYPQRAGDGLIEYVPSWAAALERLDRIDREPLLALTGVQTIATLRPFWSRRPAYFQILDRAGSWALAASSGFPRDRLIAGLPGDDPALVVAKIRELKIRIMVTKESGASGFQSTKMAAAQATGTPLLIVQRPALPPTFRRVTTEAELLARIAAELVA
jgi:precorrin-6x reductase